MSEPRPELKFTVLNLDRAVWERIKVLAKQEDRSANGLARIFLREGLERRLANDDNAQAA